jgi:hypothetical protein
MKKANRCKQDARSSGTAEVNVVIGPAVPSHDQRYNIGENDTLQGKTALFAEKSASMPLCSPQIPYGLLRG